MSCKMLSVETDRFGIVPSSLRQVMSRWSVDEVAAAKSGDVPKVLYTIPNGSNPTGATTPLERKLEVLEVSVTTQSVNVVQTIFLIL